jgi:hypothetical protein
MGQSTDAKIAFGVDFGEDAEFPWERYEEVQWWRDLNEFVNPVPEPDWSSDRTKPQADRQEKITAYFDAQRAWDLANPCPVEVVSHCSGDYPMWILAVPGTHTSANRGYPAKLDPNDFARNPNTTAFHEFCEKHGIELSEEPAWLLFSNWN